MTTFKPLLIALLIVSVLAACGSDSDSPPPRQESSGEVSSSSGGSSSAVCALAVEFRGATYFGQSVSIAPEAGEIVGEAGLPACNDTNGASEEDEVVEVASFPGLSPDIALVWPGRGDIVFIREGTEPLPPQIARLSSPPGCDQKDVPIDLRGTWIGILGADGDTETDLVPPYDLEMYVAEASHDRYLRATINVRVPSELGRPLDRDDVKSSLWEGGDIEVVSTCGPKGFVAQEVRAFPPS